MLRLSRDNRRAFTLVELMVSVTIIALLASTILVGMAGVQDLAKEQRTKSQLLRIHEMLAERWESYETRRVTFVNQPAANAQMYAYLNQQGIGNSDRHRIRLAKQLVRLRGLRELVRLELPDRMTDVIPSYSLIRKQGRFVGKSQIAQPTLHKYYVSRVSPGWTTKFQSAECLYLILSKIQSGDSNGLESFSEREIGDKDGDGMPEILDGWGNPIRFIRWAPGYTGVSSIQGADGDTMDLAAVDPRLNDQVVENDTFALFPLVFSTGADGEENIFSDVQDNENPEDLTVRIRYRDTDRDTHPGLMSDPFFVQPELSMQLGQVLDERDDGHIDNIYNHHLDTNL